MVLVDNLRLVSVSPKAKLFEPRSVNARSLSVEHAKSLQSDVASPMSALETNCPSGKGKVQDRGEYGAAGAVATTNLSYPANLVARWRWSRNVPVKTLIATPVPERGGE
jgi:hypothetical protein